VFFVIFVVVEEVCSDSLVFHSPSTLDHLEKLGMRPHKHPAEPARQGSGRCIIWWERGGIDGQDMWSIMGSIVGWEAWDVTIIESLDPLGREIEACPNWQLEVGELCVFNIPF
jgi:hypothetical protein